MFKRKTSSKNVSEQQKSLWENECAKMFGEDEEQELCHFISSNYSCYEGNVQVEVKGLSMRLTQDQLSQLCPKACTDSFSRI